MGSWGGIETGVPAWSAGAAPTDEAESGVGGTSRGGPDGIVTTGTGVEVGFGRRERERDVTARNYPTSTQGVNVPRTVGLRRLPRRRRRPAGMGDAANV